MKTLIAIFLAVFAVSAADIYMGCYKGSHLGTLIHYADTNIKLFKKAYPNDTLYNSLGQGVGRYSGGLPSSPVQVYVVEYNGVLQALSVYTYYQLTYRLNGTRVLPSPDTIPPVNLVFALRSDTTHWPKITPAGVYEWRKAYDMITMVDSPHVMMGKLLRTSSMVYMVRGADTVGAFNATYLAPNPVTSVDGFRYYVVPWELTNIHRDSPTGTKVGYVDYVPKPVGVLRISVPPKVVVKTSECYDLLGRQMQNPARLLVGRRIYVSPLLY